MQLDDLERHAHRACRSRNGRRINFVDDQQRVIQAQPVMNGTTVCQEDMGQAHTRPSGRMIG